MLQVLSEYIQGYHCIPTKNAKSAHSQDTIPSGLPIGEWLYFTY